MDEDWLPRPRQKELAAAQRSHHSRTVFHTQTIRGGKPQPFPSLLVEKLGEQIQHEAADEQRSQDSDHLFDRVVPEERKLSPPWFVEKTC